VPELRERLTTPNSIRVIDVREPKEFVGSTGHITGALNIPLGELPQRLSEARVPDGIVIVLVCLTDKRSAKAAEVLRAAGMRSFYILRGGMLLWSEG
jgi:rhodanese-related sulfurtransferase